MGLGLVYHGLRLKPGQEILTTEQDYYVTYEATRLAARRDTPVAIRDRAFLWPLLLTSLADEYPTVRYFSRTSLLDLDEEMPTPGFREALRRFDYLAPADARARDVDALWRLWRARPKHDLPRPVTSSVLLDERYEPVRDQVDALVALQARKRINIGE